MKNGMLVLLSLCLFACDKSPSEETVAGRWYSPGQLLTGKAVFLQHCASCHGDQAQGLAQDWRKRLADGAFPPPPLNGSAHAWHHPMSVLLSTIQNGGAPVGGKMPAFRNKLNQEEQLAAVAYFQSFWPEGTYKQWLQLGGVEK